MREVLVRLRARVCIRFMCSICFNVSVMHREVQFPPCAVHHASDPGAAATGEQHHLAINAYASIHGLHYPCPWDVVKEHYRTMRARMMMMIISHMHA